MDRVHHGLGTSTRRGLTECDQPGATTCQRSPWVAWEEAGVKAMPEKDSPEHK
jgi:hypothetical protein